MWGDTEIKKIFFSLTGVPQISHVLVNLAWICLYYNGCKMAIFLIPPFLIYIFLKDSIVKKHSTCLFAYLLLAWARALLFYSTGYSPLSWFILMVKFFEIWPVRVPFNMLLYHFNISLIILLSSFFLSCTRRCSRLILYCLFPRSGINHFFKELLALFLGPFSGRVRKHIF